MAITASCYPFCCLFILPFSTSTSYHPLEEKTQDFRNGYSFFFLLLLLLNFIFKFIFLLFKLFLRNPVCVMVVQSEPWVYRLWCWFTLFGLVSGYVSQLVVLSWKIHPGILKIKVLSRTPSGTQQPSLELAGTLARWHKD